MKRMFEAVVFGGAKLFWDYTAIPVITKATIIGTSAARCYSSMRGRTCRRRRRDVPHSEGMLFFFRPYQLHHVYANVSQEQPYTRTIFHFDPQLADELLHPFARRHGMFAALWQGRHPIQAFDLTAAEEAVERNFDDYERTRQEGKGEDAEEIGMLILRLIDTVIRYDHSGLSRAPGALDRKSAGYVQQAMRWIDEHYQETFYLDDLADAMHLSKFYLSKLFHEETGSTLKEYVTAKRMRQACRLLETTTKSVEWIGSEVGISNPSYFVQVFKHEVGTTPHKYRTGFNHSVQGKGKAR